MQGWAQSTPLGSKKQRQHRSHLRTCGTGVIVISDTSRSRPYSLPARLISAAETPMPKRVGVSDSTGAFASATEAEATTEP